MDIEQFGWSPEEWERAKTWATNVASSIKGVSNLWEQCRSDDSVWTLHRLNTHIRQARQLAGSPEKNG